METILIIGASSGASEALVNRLRETHEIFTGSRSAATQTDCRHAERDAANQPFAKEFLPQRLDASAEGCPPSQYCAVFDGCKVGDVDELATAAEFLLSQKAKWIIGQVLPVEDGMGSLRRFN